MTFKFYKQRAKGDTNTSSEPLRDPKTGKPLEIRLEGGAYVLLKHLGKVRKCFVTKVSDEELELLHSHPAYMSMKARGFFTERDEDHMVPDTKGNPDDMEIKDNTSQISDEDHAKGTDPRLDHAQTRATAGINNQEGGMQPEGSKEGSYGPVYL